MNYTPYVALDIETTGIEPNAQVLQIAMIFDDLLTPINELEGHSFLIDNSEEMYSGRLEPVALSMNSWIYKEISAEKSAHTILKAASARGLFHKLILGFYKKGRQNITFAGKNLQGFDIPHLKQQEFIDGSNYFMLNHRVLDTGSLYYPDFGYVPTQGEINKLIGRKRVSHDAYDDAMDVVCAIRRKLKIPF